MTAMRADSLEGLRPSSPVPPDQARIRVAPAPDSPGLVPEPDAGHGPARSPHSASLLFVIEKLFEFGGLQRDLLQIANACAERGHRVQVLTGSQSGPLPAELQLHVASLGAWTNHGRIRRLEQACAELVRRSPVDCVVGFKKMVGLDVYFAGDPCLAEILAHPAQRWKRWWPRYRAYLRNERHVFAPGARPHILLITPAQHDAFRHHYGTEPARLHLLPPGINRERLTSPPPTPQDRARLRRELGLAPDALLLLMVGSGFRTKGVDRAIAALAALPPDARHRCLLVIVGKGQPGPFLRQARRRGLADRVVFAGGRPDVARYYHAADLLVHPARQETAGHALLEALVCGLPVLTTANCGYAPRVTAARAGMVCPLPFAQQCLDGYLQEMLEPERRLPWRQNALAYVAQTDLSGLAERATDVIEQTARQRGPQR